MGKVAVIIPVPKMADKTYLTRAVRHIEQQTVSEDIVTVPAESFEFESTAMNEALEQPSVKECEYIIPHEYTNFWIRDGVERMRNAIEAEYPFIWAVHAPSITVDKVGNKVIVTNPHDGMVAERVIGEMDFKRELGNTVNYSAVIIRLSALEKLKEHDGYYFDERLRMHEDWDVWLRMLKYRGRVKFADIAPVSNWFDNPVGRHRHPINKIYKNMVYSRIKGGYYD